MIGFLLGCAVALTGDHLEIPFPVKYPAECHDAEMAYIGLFVPPYHDIKRENSTATFEALSTAVELAQDRVRESCGFSHDWFGNSSSAVSAIVTATVNRAKETVPSLDVNLALSCLIDSTVRSIMPASHKQSLHDRLMAEIEPVTAIQTTTPVLVYMSPKMWWLRADYMPSDTCAMGRSLTFVVSWILSGWFALKIQLLFEVHSSVKEKEKKDLTFSGLGAAMFSFLYAVVVASCLGVSHNSDKSTCYLESRQRFNFLWPSAIMTVYGLVLSLESDRMDPEVETFVSTYDAAERQIRSWRDGDSLVSQNKRSQSVVTNAPLRLPSHFSKFNEYFQLGAIILVLVTLAWLMSCSFQ